jgi:hypothetical protein
METQTLLRDDGSFWLNGLVEVFRGLAPLSRALARVS